MFVYPSDDGKAAFVRIPPGEDLLEALNRAAEELGVEAGTLQLLGAVQDLMVGYYRQDKHEYEHHRYAVPMEITGGVGNVSLKDGKPFVHIHVTGSGSDGKSVAGHLMPGTTVFMIEAYFRKLDGPAPVRTLNDEIGLPVWQ